jgi:alkylated DNA repair dioxygenase AlkB
MSAIQPDLFAPAPRALPEGFVYRPEFIPEAHARELVERFADLEFRPYEFRGFLANRRVISFGRVYDAAGERLASGASIPEFLLPLRAQAAIFAAVDADRLQHVLINEYRPGAGIGWHRDRPQFGDVIGVSLGAPGVLRFRRRRGEDWARAAITVEPRSAYLLRGPARHDWQHSLPVLDALRYSVTFRTLAT